MDLGIQIRLKNKDDFLKIRETLTRIGILSKKTNTLYQTCNILHKKGRFYIVHFKEMFILDGKPSSLNHDDILRRDKIAKFLEDWKLLEIVAPETLKLNEQPTDSAFVKVIPFKEKGNYTLCQKYSIGKKKPNSEN